MLVSIHTSQSFSLCQGLGKRLVGRDQSQHTSQNHTSWAVPSHTVTRTGSTYGSDFWQRRHATLTPNSELPKLSQGSSLLHKFHVFSKSSFHRFPRTHTAAVPGLDRPPPISKLAEWFPHERRASDTTTITTPLVVLAESQKPFLSHNPWTYSYKS